MLENLNRINFMTNIENTEATFVKDYFGRPQCKITILAGNIGDDILKLYQNNHAEFDGNLNLCPYVGFSFSADLRSFHMWVSSTDKSFPLYKGDNIRFKFVDDTYMQMTFLVGGNQNGREKRNIISLSDREILQLIEIPIKYVELSNYKTGNTMLYKFSRKYNNQYQGENEGRTLLQIMVHRIAGLRGMLQNSTNIE